MNWHRILAAIALGGFLLLFGSTFFLEPARTRTRISPPTEFSKYASSKATILIELEGVAYSEEDPSIRTSGMDIRTVALILRSQALQRRLFEIQTADEIVKFIGGQFLRNGTTKFRGIRIDYDVKSSRVTIHCRHQNPDHARFAAERLYAEFIKYLIGSVGPDPAMNFREERKKELLKQTLLADITLLDALQTQNSQLIKDAENAARASHHLLREQEDLILRVIQSRQAEWIRATHKLPFHVVEARVVSGPFWNRTVTDFTADVVKLEKPRADQ